MTRTRISVLITSAVMLAGCESPIEQQPAAVESKPADSITCEQRIPDDHARKIAILLVADRNLRDLYAPYPASTTIEGCYWVVSFTPVSSSSAPAGNALVHRTTGEAQWRQAQ